MDPVTALGVAAAGVQFVEFATRLLSDTVETYKSATGQTERSQRLNRTITELNSLISQVEAKQRHLRDNAAPGSPDAIFLAACCECKGIGRELAGVLTTIAAKRTSGFRAKSVWTSLAAAVRGVWAESKIQDLTERLRAAQRQIQMAALVSLWEKSQDIEGTLEQLSQQQADMAATLNHVDASTRHTATVLKDLMRENYLMEERSELVRAMWISGWSPPAQRSTPVRNDPMFGDRARSQIMSSLLFYGMQDREEAIPAAYAKTFDWLFKPQSDPAQVSLWASFPAWLEAETQDIYWISGKPGSGKSTLVKFLSHHKRLKEHLSIWSGPHPLLLASFYSWNTGTQMQKSHEGLLRTLLSQCLQLRPDLVPRVCARRWACLEIIGAEDSFLPVMPPWSLDELMGCFRTLAYLADTEHRMALLIDGLDEFSGEHTMLVELIKELGRLPGVKICVSSRPWNVFNDAFARNPSLAVQDLTQDDILHYVSGHFEAMPAFNELQSLHPDESTALLREIVSRAEGVFLWVAVVVRALIELLVEGSPLGDLRSTVSKLPRDLEDLFDAIRRRINTEHIAHASQYFLLLRVAPVWGSLTELPAVTLLLADEDEESTFHREFLDFYLNKRPQMISILRRRLYSRTKGLLEVSRSGVVRFLHRTVHEWVTRDISHIEQDVPTGFDPYLEFVKATVTGLKSLEVDGDLAHLTFPTSGYAITELSTNSQRVEHNSTSEAYFRGLSEATFWSLLSLCFQYASHVCSKPQNNARLVQMLRKLEKYSLQGASAHYDGSLMFEKLNLERSSNPPFPGKALLRLGDHTFLALAAKFTVIPFVHSEFKVRAKALRDINPEALFRFVLKEAAFGHDVSCTHINDSVPILILPMFDNRIKLVRFLLRAAPVTWKTQAAVEEIRRAVQVRLKELSPPKNESPYEVIEVFLINLQKELGFRRWLRRFAI